MQLKVISYLFILAITACNKQDGGKLIVVNPTASLDTIVPSNDFLKVDYYIVNNTKANWTPDTITTDCVCLSAFYTRDKIKPGDTLKVNVQLYSAYEEGELDNNITVKTGLEGEQATLNLKLKGFVDVSALAPERRFTSKVGTLWFKSTAIDFGTTTQGRVKTTEGVVYNAGKYPVTFTGIKYKPSFIQFDFFPRTIQPGEEAIIKAAYSAELNPEIGKKKLDMSIVTTEDTIDDITIVAFIDVKEDFSKLTAAQLGNAPKVQATDTLYNYGTIKDGEIIEHQFVITNTGGRDLIIHKVESGCGCTAAVLGKRTLTPGESTTITAKFNSNNKSGKTRIYIRVITNDPNKPYTYLVLDGVVEPKGDKQ